MIQQPEHTSQSIRPTYKYAGFWRRFFAYNIDAMLITLVVYTLLFLLGENPFKYLKQNNTASLQHFNIHSILISYILPLFYFAYFWVNHDGQTPGKSLLAIQILKKDKAKITYLTALLRYIGSLISAVIFWLGYLWMLWDKDNQTWHDKIANTVIVKTDKKPMILLAIILLALMYAIFGGMVFYQSRDFFKTFQKEKPLLNVNMNYQKSQQYEKTYMDATKFIESKDYENAIIRAHALFAYSGSPEDTVDAHNLVGEIEYYRGNKSVAAENFDSSIRILPNDPIAYEFLARIENENGNNEVALQHIKKVIELEPDVARHHYNLGGILYDLGRRNEAIAEVKKAIEIVEKDPGDENITVYKEALARM
ncbi:MAG TPA: RDD family protein [Candidatus Nitrosocosmicus sp.]|nr:RDD family protein [Candidatus Nitrosocosmicus sp.]